MLSVNRKLQFVFFLDENFTVWDILFFCNRQINLVSRFTLFQHLYFFEGSIDTVKSEKAFGFASSYMPAIHPYRLLLILSTVSSV